MLKILINPEASLHIRSKELDKQAFADHNFQRLVADMAETMLAKDGIGLAAPQVGHNIRLIVVNTKDGVMAMVNPVLTTKSLMKEWDEEGCLSVPNTFGQVKRHKKVYCRFFTPAGEPKRIEAKGLLARVLQHEIDHLDGILFIDKAKDIHRAHEL